MGGERQLDSGKGHIGAHELSYYDRSISYIIEGLRTVYDINYAKSDKEDEFTRRRSAYLVAFMLLYLSSFHFLMLFVSPLPTGKEWIYYSIWIGISLCFLFFPLYLRSIVCKYRSNYGSQLTIINEKKPKMWFLVLFICMNLAMAYVLIVDLMSPHQVRGFFFIMDPEAIYLVYISMFFLAIPLVFFIIHEMVIVFSGMFNIIKEGKTDDDVEIPIIEYLGTTRDLFQAFDNIVLYVLVIFSLYIALVILTTDEMAELASVGHYLTIFLLMLTASFIFIYWMREDVFKGAFHNRLEVEISGKMSTSEGVLYNHCILSFISNRSSPFYIPTSLTKTVFNGFVVGFSQVLLLFTNEFLGL